MNDNQYAKDNTRLSSVKYAEYVRDVTALGNPFLLLLVAVLALVSSPNFLYYLLLMVIGFFGNETICSTIKYIWHKPRPNGQLYKSGFEKIDAGSFPSIHAARIMFVYSSIGYVHFKMGHLPIVFICLIVIFAVGYSRIFLKKHFLFDVSAGYCFGFTWFLLFYFLA